MALPSRSTVHVVSNIYPHYFRKDYQMPYNDISVDDLFKDVLEERRDIEPGVTTEPSAHQLRRVIEIHKAFQCPQPDDLHIDTRATRWYEKNGWCISTEFLAKYGDQVTFGQLAQDNESVAKLCEHGMQDKVVLYVVAPPTKAQIYSILSAEKENYLDAVDANSIPPSQVASTMDKYNEAQQNATVVVWQWPTDNQGPSPVLYESAFAHAQEALGALAGVTLDDDMLSLASKLCKKATTQYAHEPDYSSDLHPLLQQLFRFDAADFIQNKRHYDSGQYKTETDHLGIYQTPIGIQALPLIIKDKRGITGQPDLQAAFSLARLLASKYRKITWVSCAPCLIVGVYGNKLSFRHACLTDRLYAEPCGQVWLVDRGPESIKEIARTLQVFRNTVQALCDSYSKIVVGDMVPNTPWLLPRPTFFGEGLDDHLQFLSRVHPFAGSRFLFTGRWKDSSAFVDVHVKFVFRYGLEVHKFLANYDHAPRILFSGDVLGGKGLKMIVMATIVGGAPTSDHLRQVEEILQLMYTEDAFSDGLEGSMHGMRLEDKPTVETKVKYVHGDLRLPNLLVNQKNRLFLLDFDWAGKEGQVVYPNINKQGIQWAEGVEEDASIKHEHDKFMLKQLAKSLEIPESESVAGQCVDVSRLGDLS